MTRRRSYALVAVVCALPRVALAFHEHSGILSNLEKSSGLARMFLKTGTFGYVPGPADGVHPAPLRLVPDRRLLDRRLPLVVDRGSQLLVAIATSVVVFEIGRRFLSRAHRTDRSRDRDAAAVPRLARHPREPRDPRPADRGRNLPAGAARREPPVVALAAALGVVCGIGILSNARLWSCPSLLAYLLWRRAGWAAAIAVPVLAAVAVAPWVVRNKVEVGCWAITTDARSIWKANNVNTYAVLTPGLWIDQVPDIPQRQVAGSPIAGRRPGGAGFI